MRRQNREKEPEDNPAKLFNSLVGIKQFSRPPLRSGLWLFILIPTVPSQARSLWASIGRSPLRSELLERTPNSRNLRALIV